MNIPAAEHTRFLHEALEDAGVAEVTTVLFRIAAEVPDGESEITYLAPPAPGRVNYAAMLAVGADLLHDYDGLHRFLAYIEVPDAPSGAIATEMRHETQHARHFNLFGPHFTDLDRVLRDLVRGGGAVRYEQIPAERDANAAARAFALERFADDLEWMAGDERFRQYTADVAAADDLLAETLAMIWENASREQIDEHTGRPLGEVVDELADDASNWHQRIVGGDDISVPRAAGQQAVIEVALSD